MRVWLVFEKTDNKSDYCIVAFDTEEKAINYCKNVYVPPRSYGVNWKELWKEVEPREGYVRELESTIPPYRIGLYILEREVL